MHREETSSGLAAVVAILMVGVAVAMGWLIFSGSVFPETNPILSGPLAGTETIEAQAADLSAVQPAPRPLPAAYHRGVSTRRSGRSGRSG